MVKDGEYEKVTVRFTKEEMALVRKLLEEQGKGRTLSTFIKDEILIITREDRFVELARRVLNEMMDTPEFHTKIFNIYAGELQRRSKF